MKESEQWSAYRKAIREHMEQGDFKRPWEWSTIVATMFIGNSRMVSEELKEIRQRGVLAACSWDTDEDCPNLIHQRYHLLQWELANPDKKIEKLRTILEVGAGYGAMTIIASRLGFRGKYYIVDLPEFEQVQRKHLNWRDVKCRTRWGEYRHPDLLISLTGLSEIPIKEREGFRDRIRPKSYLFSYAPSWNGDDNRTWFREWAQEIRHRGGPSFMAFTSNHPQIEYLVSTMEVSE